MKEIRITFEFLFESYCCGLVLYSPILRCNTYELNGGGHMLGQKTVHQRWSPILCVCVPSRVVVAVDYSTYILGNPYDSCSFIFFELFFLFIMFTFRSRCTRY